jgi:hypothetical protein
VEFVLQAGRRHQQDEAMLREIRRRLGFAIPRQIVRRGTQHATVRRKRAGDKRAVERPAKTDRQIDVLLQQVRHRIRQRERVAHFRVQPAEFVEPAV